MGIRSSKFAGSGESEFKDETTEDSTLDLSAGLCNPDDTNINVPDKKNNDKGIISELTVSTIAGCGEYGFEDGKAENAMFNYPHGICISDDNKIYVTDKYNHRIRTISDGMVSTYAGCGEQGFRDGIAENAMFNSPHGICISNNDDLYVADTHNDRIRMISNGVVSTIAGCGEDGFLDGKAEEAMFDEPNGICISNDGKIYVVDSHNNRIRMISDGMVTTIAGCSEQGFRDGIAQEAMFYYPRTMCISNEGKMYITDSGNNRIRMISDGIVSTFAGCGEDGYKVGKAENARFDWPIGMCMSDDGIIYVSYYYIFAISMISDGIVSTIAGSVQSGWRDGNAEQALFDWPDSLCMSHDGNIYLTDSSNNRIRMISGLPNSSTAFEYFELSSLLHSKSLSDMILTINNQQYHLHTTVIHSLCPMIIKYKSIIEDAKISHESLQTMFEMIYSNNTIKIRKSNPDQYQMTDLRHLVELIWLFESFQMNNQSFITTCVKQFKTEMKYFMKKEKLKSTIETLKTEFSNRIDELISLSQLHGLQTTKLVEINHFINQNNKQNENQENQSSNTINNKLLETPMISMHDIFMLLGQHTEPRVVDQQQIKSETPNAVLETQPDYTIMTHDRSYSIKCHKLILYAKWSYFRRMIESGLLESASGEMIMSDDWNATRLFDFIKYLYTHEVRFESAEDAQWLLDNSELYELIQSTNNNNEESKIAKRDFKLLIETCAK